MPGPSAVPVAGSFHGHECRRVTRPVRARTGDRACEAGHRAPIAAVGWVSTLADARHGRQLQAELVRLGRYPRLVVDERRVGGVAEIDAYTGHEGMLS